MNGLQQLFGQQAQEQKESPIPELERAIQNAMGKN